MRKSFIGGRSIHLGSVSGIPIGLHWSIALIAGLFGFTLAGTVLPASAPGFIAAAYVAVAAVVTVALLASIIAHELGHSLVAQRNDVAVTSITLFALGGVAQLESEPSTPRSAAHIALAGPAVSVAIGVAALGSAALAGFFGTSALIVAGLSWLGLINLSLAVFNMVPALPLDGGRALQAALWKRSGDRNQATISASTIGRYIGWAILGFGAWQFFGSGSGLWTMVIGWFILTSAKAEGLRARFQQHGERLSQWAPPAWETRRPDVEETDFDLRPPTRPPFTGSPFASYPFTTQAPPPPPHHDDIVDVEGHRVS